jgi:hypothetical protein
MAGVIATNPKFQFSNALGIPMSGGTLTVYVAGTTTPTNTWQDSALTSLNTNPISLDSRGECVLWLDSTVTYKFVLKNSLGVTQWTVDNITGAGALADRLRTDLAASSGSSLIGYLPAGTGAVPTTVQGKLRQLALSPEDKGAYADGSTDDAPYFTLAIATVAANGRGVIVLTPGKTYYLNSQINLCDNLVIYGYGAKLKLGTGFAGINKPLFKNFSGTEFTAPGTRVASQNITFLGVEIDGQDTGTPAALVPDVSMHGAIICVGGWTADSGVDGLVVRDCNMYSFAGAGVMAWKSSNVSISDNRFKNFFANVSLSVGSCIDLHEVSGVNISNNRLDHDSTGLSWHGMVILDWDAGSSETVIDGNIITNMNGGDGISCEGNTADNLSNAVITNNIIKDCIGQGIGVDNCLSAIVSNNVINTVGGPSILFTQTEEIVAVGNKINVAGLGGIVSRSGVVRANISNNLIQGITYEDSNYRGHGIEVVDSGMGNTVLITVTGNSIKDTGGCGIYTLGINNLVSGNSIANAGSDPANTAVLRAGIVASYNGNVSGNMVTSIGNTHYGVSSGSSAFPSVSGNRFSGSFLSGQYYIGYRSTYPIYHNFSINIDNLEYDAVANVMLGKYTGVPAGYWYRGDTFYETLPASAGYIGNVVVATPSTWKTFGLIS